MARNTDVLLTAIAPAIWGSTYLVTTELLPQGYPLTVAMLRALPAGLLSPLQVVTAETLMDLSDFSENDQAPTAGEVNEALQVCSWICSPAGASGHLPVVPWPGFPAGGCGLEQHCTPVPQPLHQPRVQLRSKVTALDGDSAGGGRRGEGPPWLG